MRDIRTAKTFTLGEFTIHVYSNGDVSAVIEAQAEFACEGDGCLVWRSEGKITPVFRRHKEARAEVLRFFKAVIEELKPKRSKISRSKN